MSEYQNIEYKQSWHDDYLKWGRGTLKIYNSCKEHGLPEPDILEKDGGFMVVLYKHKVKKQIGGQMGDTIGDTIESLTDRQLEVLELIKE